MEEINHITMLEKCGQLLIDHQLTVAFAESATAGRISAEFGLLPQAGKFLKGGIVCYDATIKERVLGVSDDIIKKYTPESAIVTSSITTGLQSVIPADIHIGCTGLTCAGGSETEDKPVGTMFLCGMMGTKELFSERVCFDGEPEKIILKTVERVAALLISKLLQQNAGSTATVNIKDSTELPDHKQLIDWAEQSDVLLFSYDLIAEKFTYMNRAFMSVFDLQTKNIEPPYLLERIHPDDQSYVLSKFEMFIAGQKVEYVEFRISLTSGERWLRISPFMITEDNKRVIVGQVIEITNSKETIDVLNNHNIKKNTILTILSHDLAGPIGTVQNLSALLKRETADLNNPRIDHFINLINKISKSNIHLIRSYIDQEFLESSGTVLFKKRVELVSKIKMASEELLNREDELRIKYTFKANQDIIYAEIDEDKFMQVINNLITNALKFTPDGGKVEVNITIQENMVLISVRDNGIGIPKQYHETLFDKFTNARRTGLRGEISTGLGMSIIKTIVEWHLGTIWFESEENKGTTFYIQLPVQETGG